MLAFLRGIRRQLVNSGSTQKYLFYALGEIALVVIGILIALQINIWNQERELRIKEGKYLIRMNEDVSSMIGSYSNWSDSTTWHQQALIALRVLEKCQMTHHEKQVFENVLIGHQILGLIPIKRTAYDEMLSTGMFADLQNDILKTSISTLYTTLDEAMNRLEYFRADLGRASEIIWKYVQFSVDDNFSTTASYEFESLCENHYFRNAIVEVVDSRNDANISLVKIKSELEKIKTILEEEINK